MYAMRRLLLLALLLTCCAPSEVTTPSVSPVVSTAAPEVSATIPPSRTAPEAVGCSVTLPATSWVSDLARVTPLPASRFSWYGDTKTLAVTLPIDGVYRVPEGVGLSAKIGWWRYLSGTVDISAQRVDGIGPEVRTSTIEGYGGSGFNPSGIEFTSEGCWRVTGSLQGHELTFVMLVRRATPGESAP